MKDHLITAALGIAAGFIAGVQFNGQISVKVDSPPSVTVRPHFTLTVNGSIIASNSSAEAIHIDYEPDDAKQPELQKR